MTNEEMIKVLQQSMQELKQDIRQEMQQSLEPINQRLEHIESKQDGMQKGISRIEDRMTRLEVSYENETNRIVSLLKEDYSRVSAAAAKTHDYNEVKSMVKDHDNALINHNERITGLEKKAI